MKLREAIPDTGLRMAALDFLFDAGELDSETLHAALTPAVAQIQAHADYWIEDDGERRLDLDCDEEVLQHGIDALGDLEVTADQLAKITALSFDGGNDIYMWFESGLAERLGLEGWELDTGGESDLYLVRSFAGLAAMPGLQRLNLDAYGWSAQPRDASPFATLTALTELQLQGAKLDNAEVLVALSLTKVRGAAGLPEPVRDALTAAGVVVEV